MHFSAQVKRVMTQAAISEDDLLEMVKRSAVITHDRGNRRYHSWLMQIDGDKVIRLEKLHMTDYASGAAFVIEDCEGCEGIDGCAECGWIGSVKRLQ